MSPRAALSVVLAWAALSACDATSVTGVWCQFPSDCHAPNECSYHRCRPRCTTGTDCATSVCLAGHCAVEQDQGCATMVGRECASPLVCTADVCSLPTAPVGDAGTTTDAAVDAGR